MAKKSEKGVVVDSNLKIEVKKKKKHSKSKGSTGKAARTVICIIAIIAVAYLLTSVKKIDVVEKQNYTVTKKVTEQQPYVILEQYQETVPLGPPKCGNTKMNFSTSPVWMYASSNGSVVCAFNLTNLEPKEGTWEYMAYIQGITGNRYSKNTVGPGETATFTFSFGPYVAISSACGISIVSLPSIEKCVFPTETFYQVVEKTRNVTRYRNVTTEEKVPVYNETTVTKTVNRFFGYPMTDFGW